MLRRRSYRFLWLLLVAGCGVGARAQEMVFTADPAQSSVEFTLEATLHTVHGRFGLRSGELRLEPQTGRASGVFIVDATSGNSANAGRDRKMHKEVLESARYPEIRYTVQTFAGSLPASGSSTVRLGGVLTLHGAEHPMTVSAPIKVSEGHATAEMSLVIPYAQWGMKDPSTFLLRVSDTVRVDVHVAGTLKAAGK